MFVESNPITLHAGDILFIPQNTFYRPYNVEDVTYIFFIFKATLTTNTSKAIPKIIFSSNEYTRYHFSITVPYITVPQLTHCSSNPDIKIIIKKIESLNIIQNSYRQLLAIHYLRELLLSISTEITANDTINPTLNQIMQYIKSNYNQNITLSILSDKFEISPSHISRLFKTELKTNTVTYINSTRVAAACDLLVNTNLSISEISEKVGFNHQHYFNRVFQELCKTTPGEFRRSNPDI